MTRRTWLGPRLRTVFDYVPASGGVADLGCDHAHVAAALAAETPERVVIAADVAPGAVAAARATLAASSAGFDVRHGDGVGVLAAGEVSTLVVAGVGGNTICEMLRLSSADALPRLGVTRLVLQPQAAARRLRLELDRAGWRFHDERLVAEGDRTYVVLVAVGEGTPEYASALGLGDGFDADFGAWVRRRPDPLYPRLLDEVRARYEALLSRRDRQRIPDERIRLFQSRIREIDTERERVERRLARS